jgi:hypothetical protein
MPIRKAFLQNVYLEAVNRRRIDKTMVKDKNVTRTAIFFSVVRELTPISNGDKIND